MAQKNLPTPTVEGAKTSMLEIAVLARSTLESVQVVGGSRFGQGASKLRHSVIYLNESKEQPMDSRLTDTEVPAPITNITASKVRDQFAFRFFRPACAGSIRPASARSILGQLAVVLKMAAISASDISSGCFLVCSPRSIHKPASLACAVVAVTMAAG